MPLSLVGENAYDGRLQKMMFVQISLILSQGKSTNLYTAER